MSRRGNSHENKVAESFFNLLKRERTRRSVYRSCDVARQNVFDYIEMFYNPKRKQVRNGMLPLAEFEKSSRKRTPRLCTNSGLFSFPAFRARDTGRHSHPRSRPSEALWQYPRRPWLLFAAKRPRSQSGKRQSRRRHCLRSLRHL